MFQNSRCPKIIVPLKKIFFKNICKKLLEIFTSTGIPKVICCDQGIVFKSHFPQAFEKKLGMSSRFLVPFYPAADNIVKKIKNEFKQILHYMKRTDSANWDKHIFLYFFRIMKFRMVYREHPHSNSYMVLKLEIF